MKNSSMHETERFLAGMKKAYFLCSRQIDGSITSVSSAVQAMLGYDSQEFIRVFPNFLSLKSTRKSNISYASPFIEKNYSAEYEVRINHKNGSQHWLKIVELPLFNEAGEIKAFDCLAHDITSHKNNKAELLNSEKILRSALGKSIRVLATTVESRDYFSFGHHQRASAMARLIAQELGVAAGKTDTIRLAGVIHDIGKISVPVEILNKRDCLNDTEYSFIQGHPEAGYNIVKELDLPWPLADIILQHHERMDGSGYPNHLSGDQILPEARILAVADVIEAMASDRAHRRAIEIESIMEELSEQKGILFDPDVVDVSMRLLDEKKIILQ